MLTFLTQDEKDRVTDQRQEWRQRIGSWTETKGTTRNYLTGQASYWPTCYVGYHNNNHHEHTNYIQSLGCQFTTALQRLESNINYMHMHFCVDEEQTIQLTDKITAIMDEIDTWDPVKEEEDKKVKEKKLDLGPITTSNVVFTLGSVSSGINYVTS